jgi:hypothetical protein
MLAIPVDDPAQNRRTRLALLRSKLVEPFDVIIRQIGKDASHDILISYRDIMSRYVAQPNAPFLVPMRANGWVQSKSMTL